MTYTLHTRRIAGGPLARRYTLEIVAWPDRRFVEGRKFDSGYAFRSEADALAWGPSAIQQVMNLL